MNEYILWHIDPLLGDNCKTNGEAIAIARQQLHKYASVLEPLFDGGPCATMEVLLEAVFSMWSTLEAVSLDQPSSVH
jgi:7,8-dihydro-6-hydroxymethylpterin-pyrophosphokinase